MPPKIVIVDYGAGNLRSVARAVAHVGHEPSVTSDPGEVAAADALIVPGVGAAADTMRNLREHRMVEPVREYIASGTAVLRGVHGAAGAAHGQRGGRRARVPRRHPRPREEAAAGAEGAAHGVEHGAAARRAPDLRGHPGRRYFYFVHSYYPQPDDEGVVIGETEYGVTFASVLARDNIVATQFHPEKSGEMGLRMYANFLAQVGAGVA